MPTAVLSARNLLDPRGRCNRRGLLVVSGLLLAIEAVLALALLLMGAAFDGPLAWIVKLALLWTAIAATSKRLHDCGHSAWWMAGATLAVMVWCFGLTTGLVLLLGPAAFAPGSLWLALTLVAVSAPVLALVVWLHCAAGEATANRFGPIPAADGFSAAESRASAMPESDMVSAG